MTASFLVEKTIDYLDRMSRFYITEEKTDSETSERADWLPPVLHDFLWHLSGPVDPTGKGKLLSEATSIILNRGAGQPGPSVHKAMNLPKTKFIIDKAKEDFPKDENLHKRLGAGFRKSFDDIENETPAESKAKYRESKQVFKEFAQSRGLKASTAPSMLHGNLKTKKSTGEGVSTTGLNLAPHATSGIDGFDVCPKASKECRANCLGTETGGNRMFPDAALSSKVLRTHFIVAHPEHAARLIDHEITAHKKKAREAGYIPGVRLNMTSDISWEHHAPKMFHRHHDVQFYDYTKLPNRVAKSLAGPSKESNHSNAMGHPNNYRLALSHTGTGHEESNDKDVIKVLEKGGVSAMVFQKAKGGHLPTHVEDMSTGKRYPVTNGDDDDNIFDRHHSIGAVEGTPGKGVISGLKLKGVKNEAAGAFANKVDEDGICRINRPSI